MKQPAILLCIAAMIFGIASPFFAGMFASSPLEAWFHLLPTAVDQWLWPEGDVLMLALAMVVFIVQYLVLFAVAAAAPPLILFAVDFLAGPGIGAGWWVRAVKRRTKPQGRACGGISGPTPSREFRLLKIEA